MIERKRQKLVLACTHSLGAKFLEGQIKFMSENNFIVYVFSAPGLEIEKLCKEEGAILISTPFTRVISPLSDLKCLLFLIKNLKEIQPDVINTGTPKAGLLVCLAARLLGFKKTIFTLRGLRSETLYGMKKGLIKGMETLTCKLANYVLPISPSLREHAIKEGILNNKKAFVLGKGSSNGVDVGKFSSSNDIFSREKEREKLGIPKDSFVISYIGRFNNDKGVPELFNAFKLLSFRHPNIFLLLVGRYEEEDSISDKLWEEIQNHPKVVVEGYRQDIRPIYETLDLLVLFSKREGFGNILIEASSMGKPVIAHRIPGCVDAVKDCYSGFLVDSQQELLERIEQYITSIELVAQHGMQGREWVLNNFASEVIWNEQLKFYQKLLKKH